MGSFMDEALDLARRIPRRTWPNPPVGAVVVKDGQTVGRGGHRGSGLPHAERVALKEAGQEAGGATLYVTLEPCNHHGRTPPCTDQILNAGITKVVAGILDPNPAVKGGGLARLAASGVDVTVGTRANECLDLIWPFVTTDAFQRPYVEMKTATSLDGAFAPPETGGIEIPAPVYLTGDEARREVHCRRRWSDLVLVGRGTAQKDRPRLDTRLVGDADTACPETEPRAGYIDTQLSLTQGLNRPSGLVFCAQDCRGEAPEGMEIVRCPAGRQGLDPTGILGAAWAKGVRTVFLEGGPRLAASFLSAGLVDRWIQHHAPIVLGGGTAWPERFRPPAGRFSATRTRRLGPDVEVVWDGRDFTATLEQLTVPPPGVARSEEAA